MLSFPIVFIAACVLLCFIQKALFIQRKRKFEKQFGCKEPFARPTRVPYLELDYFFPDVKAFYESRALAHFTHVWSNVLKKKTFSGRILGSKCLFTWDAKNIQAVFATKFHDFEFGSKRRKDAAHALGNSIFNTDGQEWSQIRKSLRPHFSRQQLVNFEVLEEMVQQLLERMPNDGQTVGLNDLFSRMVRGLLYVDNYSVLILPFTRPWT
jgi:cytochrome P450